MLSVAHSSHGAHFGGCGGDEVIVGWMQEPILQIVLRSLGSLWETEIMQDMPE